MERKLLENGNVELVTTKEVPRYEGYENYSQGSCEMIVEDLKEMNKIWTTKDSREGFECIDTKENWEPEGESIESDIESFQKYLDETYGEGKYEAFSIGAYIHSGVSFAFNKSEDRRCRWDSGTVGFIGLNKEINYDVNKTASILSDAWNGYISTLEVIDNLTGEPVDEIWSTESIKDINDWKAEMKERYGVTDYKCNY